MRATSRLTNRSLPKVNTRATRKIAQIYTTTAGSDLTTYCADIERRVEKIEQGIIDGPPGFNYLIYRASKDLPWDSEEAFRSANPSYGVLVSKAFHQEQVEKAKQSPTFRRAYCRYHLNQWVESSESFIDMESWRSCADESFDATQLEGRPCFGGLDLSRTTDLTAYSLVFPPVEEDPFYRVLSYAFLPDSELRNKELKDGVPYHSWGEQGFIDFLSGRVIDPEFIIDRIRESRDLYDLRAVGCDPGDSKEIVRALEDEGLTMLEFRQGYRSLTLPTKKLLELVIGEKIRHNNNPVLTWNVSNLKVDMDPVGNVKPNKSKSKEKIDVAVALIMALGCAIEAPDNQAFISAYATEEGNYKSIYATSSETEEAGAAA